MLSLELLLHPKHCVILGVYTSRACQQNYFSSILVCMYVITRMYAKLVSSHVNMQSICNVAIWQRDIMLCVLTWLDANLAEINEVPNVCLA